MKTKLKPKTAKSSKEALELIKKAKKGDTIIWDERTSSLNKEIAKIEKEIKKFGTQRVKYPDYLMEMLSKKDLKLLNGVVEAVREYDKKVSTLTGLKLGAELTAQEIFKGLDYLIGRCICDNCRKHLLELKKKWKVK